MPIIEGNLTLRFSVVLFVPNSGIIMNKISITHQRSEIFIVRSGKKRQAFCIRCESESVWLTIDEAVLTTRIKTREMLGFIENGEVHTLETANGQLWICAHSLNGGTR
jgi:hypothetical protein